MTFRYRMLDANGDYTFGNGSANFFIDDPDAVAQSIETRLRLIKGEWFLDSSQGTDYAHVLGPHTKAIRDQVIKTRILTTNFVTGLNSYSSSFNAETRTLSVSGEAATQFGSVPFDTSVTVPP